MRFSQASMWRICAVVTALACMAAWGADLPQALMPAGGAAMLPLRTAAEWCGATVDYSTARGAVTVQWPGHACDLPLNPPRLGTSTLDGHDVVVTPAPRTENGTLYVPASFLAQAFDTTVRPDATGARMVLTHPARDETFVFLTMPRVLLAGELFGAVETCDAVMVRRVVDIDASLLQARDGEGRTPLHIAVGTRDENVAAFLLASGAAVSARDSLGRTPLHLAATGPTGIIEALLKAGADKTAASAAGQTPFDLAEVAKLPDAMALLRIAP